MREKKSRIECGVDGCTLPAMWRDMCQTHYKRAMSRIKRLGKRGEEMHNADLRRYARDGYSIVPDSRIYADAPNKNMPACVVCGNPSHKNSLCKEHWRYIYKGGERNFTRGSKA